MTNSMLRVAPENAAPAGKLSHSGGEGVLLERQRVQEEKQAKQL